MRFYFSVAGTVAASAAVCLVLLCGCGGGSKDPNKIGSQYDKAFASADAETKAGWEASKAAMKTNGYAASLLSMQAMLQKGTLTAEQGQAAREFSKAVSDQMYAAANKGDANALQSLEEMRKASGR